MQEITTYYFGYLLKSLTFAAKLITDKKILNMKNKDEYLNKLRQFKQQYSSEYGIERIGIFGSVARGEQTESSDIDIYYEGKSLGLKSLVEFPMLLETFLGAHVDVVRKHDNLRPSFVNRIMNDIVYA
jgi:predicted nucleotidyltransferase